MKDTTKKSLQKLLFISSTFISTIYIVWRAAFSLPMSFGPAAIVFGLLLLIAEAVAVLELALEFWHHMKSVDPELPDIPDAWYPDVDVLIATHNESPALLYKTVNACACLRYPDKSKVHIYLCDDTNRKEVAALADSFAVGYFGLTGNEHAKAGNLNNALRQTASPLVLTLDADMIPKSDFLLRTVPYFFLPKMKKTEAGVWTPRTDDACDKAEKIGFIQTPQSFYNPDLFQYNLYSERNVPNEQDFFFREVNVGRNATNSALYAGSNTLIAREALQAVGNIATDSITEDFETGIKIQAAGYRTYAISETLAQGLAPTSIQSLINQRVRWARGCIQSLRNVRLLTHKLLPISTKLGYVATFLYWWTFFRRFVYILSPVLFALFNLRVVDSTFLQIAAFWLPHYALQTAAIGALSDKIRNQHWSNIIDTILFPYMSGPVIMETFGVRQTKFVVTKKDGRTAKGLSLRLYATPHILMLVICLISVAVCVLRIIMSGAFYDAVILFWLVINIKNLFFAVCFMLGRPNFRMAERFDANLSAEIECAGRVLRGETCDVSETGLSVALDRPVYVSYDETFLVRLQDREYRCEMRGELTHVIRQEKRWKYCVRITAMDEVDRRAYMQMVFDRDHSLPKTMTPSVGLYDDFAVNINKRGAPLRQSMRRLPRISVNRPPEGAANGEMLMDFNYRYVTLRLKSLMDADDNKEIALGFGLTARLRKAHAPDAAGSEVLYSVENWRELIADPAFDRLLDAWTQGGEIGAN
ncbi:MAG: glycosyltransferase [Clostridiales Family XIII bacterium]|jgi:cellulose synthase (UDP-forming)|nr:glycosyltransferase [Clostridiales Family XIII bacterium]